MLQDKQLKKLLIIACSKRKRTDASLLPAIERYDGPSFRLLRRFLQQEPSALLDIWILSAKFGLISQDELIPNYDQRMTKERALQLQPDIVARLETIFSTDTYQKFLICVGKDYLPTLRGYELSVARDLTTHIADGSLGKKLSTLYDWLYGYPPQINQGLPRNGKTPQLRGIEVTLTPEQIIDVARQGLSESTPGLRKFQSWCVPVDSQQVAPKWLVSQLTGLPVSAFSTGEARRLLTQLEIEVRRV
ncbi:MAG: DUF6884 domain-containing protein [Halothece sp.]